VVECLFKYFLTLPSDDLGSSQSSVITHDLELLWRSAHVAGISIPLEVPDWCVKLNCLHFGNRDPHVRGEKLIVPKEHRYPLRYQSGMHGLVFPVTEDMVLGVQMLLKNIAIG
jgi:hypothetical protein